MESFHDSTDFWGKRTLVDTKDAQSLSDCPLASVLSYNLLTQYNANKKEYCPKLYSKWPVRCRQLLREIFSYDADILCLQEVEMFNEWFNEHLSSAGYDSLHHNGIVISYRRDLYQLFRSENIDFNDVASSVTHDPNIASKALSNNFGLVCILQPWEQSTYPTALCISNVQLVSRPDLQQLQLYQAQFLCRKVEAFNADFQVPVIMAGSFNTTPGSDVYHTIMTGRPRPVPQPPGVIPEAPIASDATSSTIKISWVEPPSPDGPILGYKISRRMGANTALGFTQEVYVDGNVRTFTPMHLSGGVQYEFRVSAKNEYGYGPYSVASYPIMTLRMARKKTESRDEAPLKFLNDDFTIPVVKFDTGQTNRTPRMEDGSINLLSSPHKQSRDSKFSTVTTTGIRDADLSHFQCLRSAYGTYSGDCSEPPYTIATDTYVGTVDYIFYSHPELKPYQLLSIPKLESLRDDDDPRDTNMIPDFEYEVPIGWDDSFTYVAGGLNPDYCGKWVPEAIQEDTKQHVIPNALFSSDHVAIMCNFALIEENLATGWH